MNPSFLLCRTKCTFHDIIIGKNSTRKAKE
nr:MAG TPA: hypothetical protein [Caudoviricetes sp.]